MHQALASPLSLSLYFLTLIPLLTSAAILPPLTLLNNTSPLPPSTNLTALPTPHIRCVLPYPHPMDPVSLRTCKPTLSRLLRYPWYATPRTYVMDPRQGAAIEITTDRGCAISLDRKQEKGEITISLRQIVQSVVQVLEACREFGEGGWQGVEGPWREWIVVVEGTAGERW